MKLLDWQQRVVDEKNELDFKREALTDFVTSDKYLELSDEEAILLNRQRDYMYEYSEILGFRIKAFKPKD